MSARIFCKHGWQYDTDCRLEKTSVGARIVIAPPIAPLPPYSLADGGGGHGHHKVRKANRFSFRMAYLGKAVRWLRRNRERLQREARRRQSWEYRLTRISR
jgi:hypothetical protein